MATKVGQELSAFTFAQSPSMLANGQRGFDFANLDLFVKTAEAYEKELKRCFGEIVTTVTKIDEVTGQVKRISFIPREYEAQASGVIDAVRVQRQGAGASDSSMYTETATAHLLETTREIKGAKAQQYAKEELASVGGTAKKTAGTANKDMMTTYIPVMDDELNNMSNKEKAEYLRGLTPASNKASVAEQRHRTELEAEKRDKELDAMYREKQKIDKINARRTRETEEAGVRLDRTYKKKQEEEAKEDKQSRKTMLGKVSKVIAVITVIADITRRILTSVLNFGSQVSKDMVKAGTLETGYEAYRNKTYMDRALGLGEGTTIGAEEDLRAKFGNTAKLDTEALKWLAMVMGDKVGLMVQSGLGGDNPAKLNEEILTDFFRQWQQGKDQYGNEVGQEKSRRALVTLLESVSPNIARIFERMIEEELHGLHAGEITDYRSFQMMYLPASGGISANGWEQIALLGKEADLLRADFKNLGELIKGSFLLSLQDFLSWLDNLHLGQTKTEAFEEDASDRAFLREQNAKLEKTRSEANSRIMSYAKGRGVDVNNIDDLIALADMSTGGKSPERKAEIENAQEVMFDILTDSSLANLIGLYKASSSLIDMNTEQINAKNPNPNRSYNTDQMLADLSTKWVYSFMDGKSYGSRSIFSGKLSDLKASYGVLTEEDYDKGYISSSDILEFEGFTYDDIKEGKKKQFGVSTMDYLNEMMLMTDADKKTKLGKQRWSTYEAVINGLGYTQADVAKWVDMYRTGKIDSTSQEYENLMNIMVMMFNKKTARKNKLGSVKGMTNEGMEFAQSFLKLGSDEYGLNRDEWKSIDEQRADFTAKELRSDYASEIAYQYMKLTQGSSGGTIKILLQDVDSSGRILKEFTKEIRGTITKDAEFKEDLNQANEREGM